MKALSDLVEVRGISTFLTFEPSTAFSNNWFYYLNQVFGINNRTFQKKEMDTNLVHIWILIYFLPYRLLQYQNSVNNKIHFHYPPSKVPYSCKTNLGSVIRIGVWRGSGCMVWSVSHLLCWQKTGSGVWFDEWLVFKKEKGQSHGVGLVLVIRSRRWHIFFIINGWIESK